jgi:hypothetical protein
MKYRIRCSDGWVATFLDKKEALEKLKLFRETFAIHGTHKLYRVATRSERLRTRVLRDSARFDEMADSAFGAECRYFRGYARALRDIAGQL